MNPLGANWRTSISGYIETLCLIATALAILPSDIWSNPKVWIPAVTLAIAKTIKDTLTKDRSVTGGTTQQDANGAPVPEHKAELVEITHAATPTPNP